MIEIVDGLFVVAQKVAAIKDAGDGKCVVYLDGQSAMEGFVVERDAVELAEEIMGDDEED